MKILARSFFIAAIFAFSIYAQNAWSPKMQTAAMQSNLDWFEKYLGGYVRARRQ